ncbi:GNAT family N-acetyltransferase [Pseudonocardia sp. CA-107938]|uniref:GNAT family N-acetyltransferase n=1 Tax=Pseudonocardia sp. CA-107938 TaxID=3240021 RepID=UPI003D8E4539
MSGASVEVVLHADGARFAAHAQEFYARDPERHTLALTVLDGVVRHGDPASALATVHAAGAVVGALLCSPRRPPIVSGVAPDQAGAVVDALADGGFRAIGARGPTAEAQAYAAAHVARHGGNVTVGRATRLFALGTLVPPVGVPGRARPADVADAELMHGWRHGFEAEAEPPGHVVHTVETVARDIARSDGGVLLWTVDDQPVAWATARVPVGGMSRIGPVYTAPEHRGRGYGAAVTAAAARWALDHGADRVLLFTDLANPVSNRLYPRIGFAPVYDGLDLDFND